MRTAIAAGVRCIEHGQLLDEETVALMAENGIWWCLQPFLDDEDAPPLAGPNRAMYLQMAAGTDNAYQLAIKHQVHVAFGTDLLERGLPAASRPGNCGGRWPGPCWRTRLAACAMTPRCCWCHGPAAERGLAALTWGLAAA